MVITSFSKLGFLFFWRINVFLKNKFFLKNKRFFEEQIFFKEQIFIFCSLRVWQSVWRWLINFYFWQNNLNRNFTPLLWQQSNFFSGELCHVFYHVLKSNFCFLILYYHKKYVSQTCFVCAITMSLLNIKLEPDDQVWSVDVKDIKWRTRRRTLFKTWIKVR